jgi:hypothetical protein
MKAKKKKQKKKNYTNGLNRTSEASLPHARTMQYILNALKPSIPINTPISSNTLKQHLQRPILALLQRLIAPLTNAQATKHTAVSDLNVELLARKAWQGTPHILRDWHVAMLLEALEMHLVQLRRHGLNLRRDEWRWS